MILCYIEKECNTINIMIRYIREYRKKLYLVAFNVYHLDFRLRSVIRMIIQILKLQKYDEQAERRTQ